MSATFEFRSALWSALVENNLDDNKTLTVIATAVNTAGTQFLFSDLRVSSGWHGPGAVLADGNPITGISSG